MLIYLCLFFSLVSGYSDNILCGIEDKTSTFESMYVSCFIDQFLSQPIYSASFTSNRFAVNDASRIELNCTTPVQYLSVTCLIKVNMTDLQSGFYHLKMIVSKEMNNSRIVTMDSDDIQIYVPKELETPECKLPNYNDACSDNPKDWVDSSFISCVAAVPVAKVNCSIIDISKSDNVTTTSYEAESLYAYHKGEVRVHSARCYIPFNRTNLMDVLNVNVTFSYDYDYDNESLVSHSSTSFSVGCPKVMNFTVNASPDGVCANIGDKVTFSCVTDVPSQHKVLQTSQSEVDFPDKTMTWQIKDTLSYGSYICSVGDNSGYLQKSVYVLASVLTKRKGKHTFYELQYAGINNDTAFALIGIYGCPEPTTITVLRKKVILTKGVLVTYSRDPQWLWYSLPSYTFSGVVNVTFLNKDLTQDLPEYSLNVSNGISYTIIDFGVYYSDASLFLHSTAVCLLCVVILQALLY